MEALYIVWTEEYNTGIKIIDEQHRGLVSLINSFYFHRAEASRDIEQVLVPTAEMFKAYCKINFYTVEKMMTQSGFPELDYYRKLHHDILSNIAVEDSKYRASRDADGLLKYLKSYWLNQVRNEELNYIPYLKKFFKI